MGGESKKISDVVLRILVKQRVVAYKNQGKDFKNLSKDHLKLEKTLQDQVDGSLDEFAQACKACDTPKEKKSKLCIEIETNAHEKVTLLKNFMELENKPKDLQKDLKELNELRIHKNEERYDLWRECAQAHKDYV
ncbi:hypothetical protein HKD37_18G050604 [Glycine soja]